MCSAEDVTIRGENKKPLVSTTGSTRKSIDAAKIPARMTSPSPSPLRRPTSGRQAPPSPLTRQSTSGSTTVITADIHCDAAAATQSPWISTSGPPPRPRDHHRPEVVAPPRPVPPRIVPQRQQFAAPADRRWRAPRSPVTGSSAAADRDQRHWSSLEHGVMEARRSAADFERPTRRVHSYEDRYLLQRQKPLQMTAMPGMTTTMMMMPHVRRRLPNANDPLRITEFSTGDDDDDFETNVYSRLRQRPPVSPARQ